MSVAHVNAELLVQIKEFYTVTYHKTGQTLQSDHRVFIYSKTCVKRPLKNRQNEDLNDKW